MKEEDVIEEAPTSFNDFLAEAINQTRELNAKTKKVAGERGILRRLNERHITFLNILLAKPGDKEAYRKLKSTLKAERKIIKICRGGLDKYENIIKNLERMAKRAAKTELVEDMSFLLSVIKKFNRRLKDISKRAKKEETVIDRYEGDTEDRDDEIRKLIEDIKKEVNDFKKMIKQSKPKKLWKILSVFRALAASRTTGVINKMVSGGPTPVNPVGATLSIPLIPISIIETIFNIIRGFYIDEQELKEEIGNLKEAAA